MSSPPKSNASTCSARLALFCVRMHAICDLRRVLPYQALETTRNDSTCLLWHVCSKVACSLDAGCTTGPAPLNPNLGFSKPWPAACTPAGGAEIDAGSACVADCLPGKQHPQAWGDAHNTCSLQRCSSVMLLSMPCACKLGGLQACGCMVLYMHRLHSICTLCYSMVLYMHRQPGQTCCKACACYVLSTI
jgi:hypothetical protein